MSEFAHLNSKVGATTPVNVSPGETYHTLCGIDYTSVYGSEGAATLPVCAECEMRSLDFATEKIKVLSAHARALSDTIDEFVTSVDAAYRAADLALSETIERFGVTIVDDEVAE